MAKKKFIRKDWKNYSKLGKRRKNKQKYRKGKGIDNKMRLKIKGHLRNINIGFRSEKKTRYNVNGLRPVVIRNLEALKNLNKKEIGLIGNIGYKNKAEIADYALKNKIRLLRFNPEKFLKKIEISKKKAKEKKEKRKDKKITKSKKTKKEAEKKLKEESKKNKNSETLEDSVKNNETNVKENVEDKKWI